MKNVDMKQLALLCELVDQQSLTEAAARLCITPSAASQSLTRLRQLLSDDLYIREHNTYQLTPFGEASMESFRQIVDLWRGVSSGGLVFEPASCDQQLSLSCYEGFGSAGLAEFYRHIREQAPRLKLDIHTPTNGPQDVADLRSGLVDIVCSHHEPPADAADLHMETVKHFRVSQCCLAIDHPRIGDTLTLDGYVAEGHLLITFLRRPGAQRSPIDQALEAMGRPARRTSVVNSWHLCAEMVAGTDRLVTTSEEQAALLRRASNRIRCLPLPEGLPRPEIPVNMLWHQRTHQSPPHRWLRLQLRDYLANVAPRP